MTTDVQAAPETTVTPARRPFSINICEPATSAFNKAAALIRQGYIFYVDIPVMVTNTGVAMFTLVLGTPDESAYAKAGEEIQLGLDIEAAAYQRDVEARAKTMLEDYKREQAAVAIAALKAQQAKDVAALEKQTAAAIAAL